NCHKTTIWPDSSARLGRVPLVFSPRCPCDAAPSAGNGFLRRVDTPIPFNRIESSCRPEGRHDSFSTCGLTGCSTVTSHLMPTYARVDLAFERGDGAWLTATNGDRYLDFAAGVAVNVLGHAHPHLVAALTEQVGKVWHVSNLYRIPQGERLAARLCAETFADVVFFGNSGAEAMECAITTARKYHSASGAPGRCRISALGGAFHGRTLATLAAGGQKKHLDGLGPVVEGFTHLPLDDAAAVRRQIGPETAAIVIEPLQGEGG